MSIDGQTEVFPPLSSLDLIDNRLADETDRSRHRIWALLRERLIGELLGDFALIERGTGPTFRLVTRMPGSKTITLERENFLSMQKGAADSDAMVWSKFDHLLLDGNVLMCDGLLHSVASRDGASATVNVTPVVIVIEFGDDTIANEIVYLDASGTQQLTMTDLPTRDELIAKLLPEQPNP